ncbi:hypothetical protein [Arenibaculum pallidiluteum]|uniref:hypothetical protein n=1 Tax=Arenibaculum pallidiluteum TaxID=2812559 RepID=UPI001A974385|nr:hypothetical protein [Arenibaculum pallidiluteum]
MSIETLLNALLAKRGQDYFAEFKAFTEALLADNAALLTQALGATTSASPHSVSTGSKTFAMAEAIPYGPGAFVLIARASDPATWLFGQVTARSGADLTVNVTLVDGAGGSFSDWAITASGPRGAKGATGDVASFNGRTGAVTPQSGDYTAAMVTNSAAVNVAQTFTAAQRGAIAALADGATITPDFAVANFFTVTLGGNRTLANPANLVPGQSGSIIVRQDATGSRTLAYGSHWKFPGASAPVLTTAASRVDRLDYLVVSGTEIHAALTRDIR